tara:strand:+ start:1822 stop:2271 length:450 start_codon:yes stop_codon:yes gene_type:complete
MTIDEKDNLRLIGKNEEDLKIISAYLQDSIVLIRDIVFLKKNRVFIMILNRFMWEDIEKGVFRKNKRIRCAVKFEEVLKVHSKNINQKKKSKPLEYLAIKASLTPDNTFKIKIFFSGDSIITIVSEVIEVAMNDLGKPWKVKYFPLHKI